MKKRIISILLTLVLLLSTGTLVTAQESSDSTATETTSFAQITDQVVGDVDTATESASLVPYRDGDVPAGASVADSITPPISALIMCMLELNLDYDQSDESFYWSGLYYMMSLYGQMDSRAQFTDDTLILPSEAAADYAAALFAGYTGLPALPDTLAERITYTDGEYHLARGDAGQLSTVISTSSTQTDGSLLVTGALTSSVDGQTVCTFVVKLQPNDGMFGYAISDALITS